MATQLVHNQMQQSLMSTQPVHISKSALSMRRKDYSAKRVEYQNKSFGQVQFAVPPEAPVTEVLRKSKREVNLIYNHLMKSEISKQELLNRHRNPPFEYIEDAADTKASRSAATSTLKKRRLQSSSWYDTDEVLCKLIQNNFEKRKG